MSLDKRDIKDVVYNHLSGLEETLIDVIYSHVQTNPYKVTCADCGNELVFDADVDYKMDISLSVHPCGCGGAE